MTEEQVTSKPAKVDNAWSLGKKIRFGLFILGLLLLATSWLLDNPAESPYLLKLISPKYSSVKRVFDVLDNDRFGIVPVSDAGSQILLRWWKPKPPKEIMDSAKYISRLQIILDAATGKSNFYELILTTDIPRVYYKNYVWWNDLEAKKLMRENLDYWKYAYFKIIVFTISFLIAAISGGYEYFTSYKK